MTNKRVGILIDALHSGGVEKVAINQVAALNQIGVETSLVVLRRTPLKNHPFSEILAKIPVMYLDDKLPWFLKLSFKFPYFSFFSLFHLTYPLFLPWIINKDDFRVIISHGTYSTITSLSLKLFLGIPYFLSLWDPIFYILKKSYPSGPINKLKPILLPLGKFMDRVLVKSADRILIAGNAHADYLKGIASEKIIILYPGVEVNKEIQDKKDNYIISATAWKEGKNPEYLLELLKKLPSAKLVVAGSWYPEDLLTGFKEKVISSGFENRVDITGPLSEEELRRLYSKATVFLQISDDRGFGMAALEAASCGCPFIIPEHQGVGELFTDGEEGYITRVKDSEQISFLIDKLLKNPDLARKMGYKAWEKVSTNYTWEKHAQKLNFEILKALGYDRKSLHVLFTGLVSRTMLSGGDQLFLDIGPRLPKDYKLVIITPYFAREHWDNLDKNNIEFKFLHSNVFDFKDNLLMVFLSYLIRSWQVYRILRKEKIQTIYSCSDVAHADIWPAYFAVGRNPNIKWLSRVYHVLLPPSQRQGNYLANVIAFRLQRLSFWMMKKRSSTVFALNQKLYEEIINLGFPKNKLGILGAGIDYQKISNYKPTKKYHYDAVVLGRIAPVKGIFDTVKIWRKVHDANPELNLAWIGGGGENYQRKLKELLVENQLTDSFHLLGFIDKDEVYNILKSAKVFLCPDHENGWGLAVCEAMASGLPVISYNIDIFGGVYKKGFKSVPLFDTDSFANELISLLNNPVKRKELAQDAQDQASKFDHQQVVDNLVSYLDSK